MKSCGNCKHFTRIRHWVNGAMDFGGLCELNDWRTTAQVKVKSCKGYKRIKFHKQQKEATML